MTKKDASLILPGGFVVPVQSWTRFFFGVIAIIAVSFGVYRYFYPPLPELVTARQANAILQREVQEYNKHIIDDPVVAMEDNLDHESIVGRVVGHVAVRVFADGCVLLSRRVGNVSNTRLLVDPPRTPVQSSSWVPSLPPLVATVEAQGRCLNPHPGQFKWSYGARVDACWVQVHREFADSCRHIQLFNSCSGAWATNRDGSPAVQWTRCVHN